MSCRRCPHPPVNRRPDSGFRGLKVNQLLISADSRLLRTLWDLGKAGILKLALLRPRLSRLGRSSFPSYETALKNILEPRASGAHDVKNFGGRAPSTDLPVHFSTWFSHER